MKNNFFYLIIFCFQSLYGYANNPPNARTGAPGESTCASGNCHNSYPLNSGSGEIFIDGPLTYSPGEIINFTLHINQIEQDRWGFELCSLTGELNQAGMFITQNNVTTQISSTSGITYLKQTSDGTFNGQQNIVEWDIEWETPLSLSGPITFYFSGNAANGNGNRTGDYIYINNYTLLENQINENCISDGDVNMDNALDVLDIVSIISFILNISDFNELQFCIGDINIDLNIDVLDIVFIISIILTI